MTRGRVKTVNSIFVLLIIVTTFGSIFGFLDQSNAKRLRKLSPSNSTSNEPETQETKESKNEGATDSAPRDVPPPINYKETDLYARTTKRQLQNALELAQKGQFQAAAIALYHLSRRSDFVNERAQIKYILGLMLLKINLPQIAAFQFVEVIKSGNSDYTRRSIVKLSTAADILGDDTILNYAISRVNIEDFPSSEKDMLYYRMGEISAKAGNFEKAIELYGKVPNGSPYYNRALANKGVVELETKNTTAALQTFRYLFNLRRKAPVTDTNRVAAQLGIARTLYQKQDWDGAIEAYSLIPRDHVFWHDAIFEESWAMFRGARFRSAISLFHSLHSSYYEDFYIPESLLLRAIVYLYICKYDEMEKVLNKYQQIYGTINKKIGDFVKYNKDSQSFYADLEKAQDYRKSDGDGYGGRLPYIVLKRILDEGDVKRSSAYMDRVFEEKDRIEHNQNLRLSALGQLGIKILNNRLKNTRSGIGEMVKAHLLNMQLDLKDYDEQAQLIHYEMTNGQTQTQKKKISGKEVGQVDEKYDREFYIKNGYQYYPFQGEFWLDEIGNYHYLGKQSCE